MRGPARRPTAPGPLAAAVLLAGCAGYEPMPLSPEAVESRLAPRGPATLRARAREIRHPILRPIALDDRDGLSPDEAAVLAVLADPSLRAARDRRAEAAAQLLQAGLLPNPELSAGLEVPTGGRTSEAVTGYGLGMDWEVTKLVTRGARRDGAAARAASVDLEIAWREWQVAEAAKAAVLRLVALTQQVEIARAGVARLEAALARVREAVAKGTRTAADVAAIREDLQAARATFVDLEGETGRERLTLDRLLGLAPGTIVRLQAGIDLPARLRLLPREKLLGGLEDRRLDLLALRRGYEAQEASLRAAILSRFPRIRIGPAQSRDIEDIWTAGLGVSIELPIFDRKQGRIAAETATRQRLFDEYASRLFAARSDVAMLLARIETTARRIAAAEEAVAPERALVEAYARALEAGRTDSVRYDRAWSRLARERIALLALRRRLGEARIALELATGLYHVTEEGKDASASGGGPSRDRAVRDPRHAGGRRRG